MTIIVIPCYQGAATVGAVVEGALGSRLPVVVVDDGSTDGSGAIAEAAGATVLRHPENRGKGAALATGFAHARSLDADAVLTLDADGQHDVGEIERLLLAHAQQPTALVVGVRSFSPESMPRRSRIGNRISTFWISRFAGVRYQDTQSGFRIYPAPLLRVRLRSTRFESETELLLHAAKQGVPLIEVPIRTIYGPNRVTHFHGFRDTLRVMRLVLGSPLWLLPLALLVGWVGCAQPRPRPLPPASGSSTAPAGWRTQRAEHRVRIEAVTEHGPQRRTLRGLIAVERPDRFRLRGLGPGGITLFDLRSIGGKVEVLHAIRDPNDATFGRLLESMAGDLQAAYDLEPRPPTRRVHSEGSVVVIEEPGRTVRQAGRSITIHNAALRYDVAVEVIAIEYDVALDPELWLR